MPRVPYAYPAKGESPIADKIRERRKNGELIPLDGVFLNAPDIAAGYDSLLSAVRNKNSLDGALRELLILRVAALNGAAYEWKAHEPVGRNCGLTTAQLREIRNVKKVGYGPRWMYSRDAYDEGLDMEKSSFSDLYLAAMEYTDVSTRTVKVPEKYFARLKTELERFTIQKMEEGSGKLSKDEVEAKVNQQLVEITATIGAYNLVSRFLVGLNVGDMADADVPNPSD